MTYLLWLYSLFKIETGLSGSINALTSETVWLSILVRDGLTHNQKLYIDKVTHS
jgi:hypothetical protein